MQVSKRLPTFAPPNGKVGQNLFCQSGAAVGI